MRKKILSFIFNDDFIKILKNLAYWFLLFCISIFVEFFFGINSSKFFVFLLIGVPYIIISLEFLFFFVFFRETRPTVVVYLAIISSLFVFLIFLANIIAIFLSVSWFKIIEIMAIAQSFSPAFSVLNSFFNKISNCKK